MKKVIPKANIQNVWKMWIFSAFPTKSPAWYRTTKKIETNYNDLQRSRGILWTIESYNNGYENSMQ